MIRKKNYYLILFLYFFLFLFQVFSNNTKKIIITGVKDMYLTKISEPILVEAYQELGIDVIIKTLPGERALIEANSGRMDGDLNRKAGLEKKYANLVMIPVSLLAADWVVFARNIKFRVNGWKSLKPYSIAIQRGLRVAEDGTEGMNPIIVNSIEQLFEMLNSNRIDIVVSTRLEGLISIKKLGMNGIVVLEPSIQVVPLYHYIHKKHIPIANQLTRILAKMKKNGRIKEITDEVLDDLLN